MKMLVVSAALLLASGAIAAPKNKQADKKETPSALQKTIETLASSQQAERAAGQVTGSLWSPSARFNDLAADLRGRRVGDVVTIQVNENASAVSTGTVKTSRASSLQSNISALGGITKATGPWANLANLGTTSSLNGQGTTGRTTTLTATVSAVVTQVLPNGSLVVEGIKNVGVNSENQTISVRGIIRPVDLDTTNSVSSDRVAQMELRVNGKGVVADATKRPFILYRLLMGLLPF